MTSTRFNVGLNENTRLSSRVLRPPGGGHTDIFGGEPEPPRTGRRMAPNAVADAANPTGAENPQQNGQVNTETPPAPAENAVPDNNIEVVTNPEPKTEPQKPAETATPQRVRVPPGGFSSGLW